MASVNPQSIRSTGGSTTANETNAEEEEPEFFAALDEDITAIRRKTMAIKSDNV